MCFYILIFYNKSGYTDRSMGMGEMNSALNDIRNNDSSNYENTM